MGQDDAIYKFSIKDIDDTVDDDIDDDVANNKCYDIVEEYNYDGAVKVMMLL